MGSDTMTSDDSGFEAELALSGDDSLPWLESDEYEQAAGELDTARIIGLVVVILAMIGVGLGAAWWFANRDNGADYIADGSTVAAPAGPYKERPKDPGGKEFEGSGSVASAVGEGQTREGVLRKDEPSGAAAPSIATLPVGEEPVQPRPSPAAQAPEAAAEKGGVSVQVGAYRSEGRALAGWQTLQRQTTALNGVNRRIVKGEADIGTVYRLQALPGDLAAARALCDALKADGIACQVKR
ncbi:SPOR domain-containing protein [Altererythrobacter sp. GH1-8]|uniref:SPOR domain-containing protein n=1 Tax=Altererythrobacter sp. GH1-8 TaxID=3349333 RepID=UPI00374DE69B